jgi:hypothetical protein
MSNALRTQRRRLSPAWMSSLGWLGLLLFLTATWVLPYRLLNDTGNSFYTFGFVGDEYFYAERIQPLVGGATAVNTVSGLAIRTISPFYLENLCHLQVFFRRSRNILRLMSTPLSVSIFTT